MLLYELRNNGLSVRRGPFDAVEREEAIWVGIYIYSLGVLRNFEAGALLRKLLGESLSVMIASGVRGLLGKVIF